VQHKSSCLHSLVQCPLLLKEDGHVVPDDLQVTTEVSYDDKAYM
jgi:hypothetical protein